MIAFPSILHGVAKDRGMKVPEIADDYEPLEYPHYHVYLIVQLGASLPYPSAHWDNASLIAGLEPDVLQTITMAQLIERGLSVGNSSIYM